MSDVLTIRQLLDRFEVETQGEFLRLVNGLDFPRSTMRGGRKTWLLADVEAFERDLRARVAADPPPILDDDFDDFAPIELPPFQPILF